ncbi:MAG: alcohol dehydrogenase catalytic domain-containing protein [Eubacteriales bacterium]|nr:alcohol dehydrogenase catalytic domain-containing protein [Eubacteriales bacterium]
MATMQAAVFKGNGILKVETVEIPKITEPNQVLLKVEAASICGSDIHALHVPPGQVITEGVVMGHEFFGTIVQVGEKAGQYQPGDCVVVHPSLPCGECWECKHGMENLCVQPRHYGQTCDGGFAEYVVVETSQIYELPKDINPDIAAQTEPLACIMYSLGMVQPAPTDHVLLYGAGPIGLTFIKVLKIFGVKNLAVVAKGAARIEQARQCGADFVIDMQDGSPAERIREAWGCLADVVVDAVGTGQILSEAMTMLNSKGRLLLFGLNHNARGEVPPAVITQKELQVVGSLGKAFPPAISLLQDERLRLDELVTHRVALQEINHAIELLKNKKACRVIVYPNR